MIVVVNLLIVILFLCALTIGVIFLLSYLDKNKVALRHKFGKEYTIERVVRTQLKNKYYICSKTISEIIDNHFVLCVFSGDEMIFEYHLNNTTEEEVKVSVNKLIARYEFDTSKQVVEEKKA